MQPKLIVGFQEDEYDLLQNLIRQKKIAGVIFFRHNIGMPTELKSRIQHLKSLNSEILVAVDQEGGQVQRLRANNGFQDFLSAAEVAKQYTPEEAETYYESMAYLMHDMGFNLVFGPVVDLNPIDGPPCPVIGKLDRSYGSDPTLVAQYAKAFINAHKKYGIQNCLKHFPGHGYAQEDSHLGLVDSTSTWNERELKPYRLLIDDSPMIMSAHLMVRSLDPDFPATLSPKTLQNLLRDQLGYKGIIISDDLHMGAIQEHFTLEETITLSLKAGCNILLFSFNKSAAPRLIEFNPSLKTVDEINRIIHNHN